MGKLRIAVLGSTRGTDMQAIIDAIQKGELDAEIVVVISDKKDALILDRAKMNNIETFTVDYLAVETRKEAEEEIAKKLREKDAELILLIGYMKVLTVYFVDEFRRRIWNIHPSLLPKYAGSTDTNVHELVIKNHDRETGCTLHEVTENIDSGRIILQKKIEVSEADTPETLKEKVQKIEGECFLEAIKMVTEGKISIGDSSGQ